MEKFFVNEDGKYINGKLVCVYSFFDGKWDMNFSCVGDSFRDTRKQFKEKHKSLINGRKINWNNVLPYKATPNQFTDEDVRLAFENWGRA